MRAKLMNLQLLDDVEQNVELYRDLSVANRSIIDTSDKSLYFAITEFVLFYHSITEFVV